MLEPNWKFENSTAYIVDGKSGVSAKQKIKIYVATLMSRITKSNKSEYIRESIPSPNEIFLNSNRPNTSSIVKHQNFIEVEVEDDIIIKKSNEALHQKYLDTYPNTPPVYFIPQTATFKAGERVTVESLNNDLSHLKITL